jgi:hypothetical protein
MGKGIPLMATQLGGLIESRRWCCSSDLDGSRVRGRLRFCLRGGANVAALFDREIDAREAWSFRGCGAIRRRLMQSRTIFDPFSAHSQASERKALS